MHLLLPRRLPHAEAAEGVGVQSIVFRPGNKGTREGHCVAHGMEASSLPSARHTVTFPLQQQKVTICRLTRTECAIYGRCPPQQKVTLYQPEAEARKPPFHGLRSTPRAPTLSAPLREPPKTLRALSPSAPQRETPRAPSARAPKTLSAPTPSAPSA